MAGAQRLSEPKATSLSRRLFAPGIARKLVLINLLPFLVVIALTIVLVLMVNVLSGLRAYVAGEGLYSKYQKDAVFYLQRYVERGNEADYLRYFRDISVPVGDDLARQELEKIPPDTAKAAIYFLQGENAPADVPDLISLFLRFRRVPFVERAVQIWTDANTLIDQLLDLAAVAHHQIAAGQMTPDEKERLVFQIGALNDQLIGLENDFSRTLGEGFDLTSNLLFYAMIAIDGLVLLMGFLLSRTLGRSIAGDIGKLSQSVSRIAAGDLSARAEIDSEDELGELAHGFNAMASNIQHARHELERARDAALQSSRLKSSFLANMSHEIRTPLHMVLAFADVVAGELGDNPDPGLAADVEAIRRTGQRLVRTFQAILDFSQIEAGAFELHLAPVNPASLMADHVRELQVQAGLKGLELKCQIEEPEQTTIMFDEYCLSGALMNLLSNAIKFTERGSITARLFRADGAPRIEVRDTGIGINPSYLPHLFEPFSQEHDRKSPRQFEGTGLGLALTRRYLQLNRANLAVESTLGKGSVFTIEFPQGCELPATPAEPAPQPLTLVSKAGS